MDLLLQIAQQPVDPDYAAVAARGPRRRQPWLTAVVLCVAGALFALSALQTSRRAPVLATERTELIARIGVAEAEQDRLRAQAATLTEEIAGLRRTGLGDDAAARDQEAAIVVAERRVGAAAVRGPGLEVTVDDAPRAADDRRDRVLDLDLQTLVNGLWEAGAEAVAINGHRLSALTAIRGAGEAITVDYRSLTRPYAVQAVGDPRTLPADFAETSGGRWWQELHTNRGLRFETRTAEDLTLPADPGMVLRYASEGRR